MSLKTGFYFLSAFTLNNRAIGANPGERIRPVIVQPPGSQAQKWHLQHISEEEYILTFGGQPAGNVNGHVALVALVPGTNSQFRWKLVPVDSPSPVIYAVLDTNGSGGWSVNDESDQVKVSELVSSIAFDGPILE